MKLLIAVIIALVLLGILFVTYWSYQSPVQESFESAPSVEMPKDDYFYQFLPKVSAKLLEYIDRELDAAVNQDESNPNESARTFVTDLTQDKDIRDSYMQDNLIMTSTKVSVFLDVDSYFNVDTKFAANKYTTTSTGASRSEFVTTLIQKFFQNYMVVNALDAYNAGVMPVYTIQTSVGNKDDDSLVNEAAIVLQMVRKYASIHGDTVKETIPSFSMTRVYASVQDRLEAKCAHIFRMLQDVDITRPETLQSNTTIDSTAINNTTKETKKNKVQALEQTQSYNSPFLVAILRSINETKLGTPEATLRRKQNGDYVQFASRTGVSSRAASNYEVVPVGSLGSGYVPEQITLLGESETDTFKERLRNAFAIMMKKLKAHNTVQSQCSTQNIAPEKQYCSGLTADRKEVELVEELVYYVMGFYKTPGTKAMIEKEMSNLKSLASHSVAGLSDDYIRSGLFETDELALLNTLEHRHHFIGPYTACMRNVISVLSGVSGNSKLRDDLALFDDQKNTMGEMTFKPETFANY